MRAGSLTESTCNDSKRPRVPRFCRRAIPTKPPGYSGGRRGSTRRKAEATGRVEKCATFPSRNTSANLRELDLRRSRTGMGKDSTMSCRGRVARAIQASSTQEDVEGYLLDQRIQGFGHRPRFDPNQSRSASRSESIRFPKKTPPIFLIVAFRSLFALWNLEHERCGRATTAACHATGLFPEPASHLPSRCGRPPRGSRRRIHCLRLCQGTLLEPPVDSRRRRTDLRDRGPAWAEGRRPPPESRDGLGSRLSVFQRSSLPDLRGVPLRQSRFCARLCSPTAATLGWRRGD